MFKFPYTNLHELNLDWILEKVKHFAELIPPMETAVDDVQSLTDDVAQAVEDANQAVEDAQSAIETAEEAKEIAEQAAQGTIADGAVTTVKLDDEAVTTAKIDDGAVTGAKIASGTIQSGNLSSGCVTTTQILDGTISPDDLGTECVTNSKLGAGAVTTTKIDDGAVTTAKLGAGAVTNAKIADGAVSGVKVETATGTINFETDITPSEVKLIKKANIVWLKFYVNATFTSSERLVCKIPDGFRPTENVRFIAGCGAQAYFAHKGCYCSLNSNGNFYVTPSESCSYVDVNVVYMTE